MNTRTKEFEDGAYLKQLVFNQHTTSRTGLCVGWNLIDHYQSLDVAVIGSLYSRDGAYLLLRNLYRCPFIRVLIVLDDNKLGHNQIGQQGIKALRQFFLEDHNPFETTEFDPLVLSNLTVCFVGEDQMITTKTRSGIITSKNQYTELSSLIRELETALDQVEREPIIYRQPQNNMVKQKSHSTEHHGSTIVGNSIVDAWLQTLEYVHQYGVDNTTLRQFHSVHWSFPTHNYESSMTQLRNKITQENVRVLVGLDERALEEYSQLILNSEQMPNIAYTYGQRLALFKPRMLEALKNDLMTRHAFATTIRYDTIDTQPPCLVYLQFLYEPSVRQLNLYAVFRSHDLFKGALANAYALCCLLKTYCQELNIAVGFLEITSISAHIYLTDLYQSRLFLECTKTNEIHMDPRGYCVVTRVVTRDDGDRFVVEIHDNQTHQIYRTLTGRGSEIFSQILKERIFTSLEHLEYLYGQLH
jgi:thymidylate synthase